MNFELRLKEFLITSEGKKVSNHNFLKKSETKLKKYNEVIRERKK